MPSQYSWKSSCPLPTTTTMSRGLAMPIATRIACGWGAPGVGWAGMGWCRCGRAWGSFDPQQVPQSNLFDPQQTDVCSLGRAEPSQAKPSQHLEWGPGPAEAHQVPLNGHFTPSLPPSALRCALATAPPPPTPPASPLPTHCPPTRTAPHTPTPPGLPLPDPPTQPPTPPPHPDCPSETHPPSPTHPHPTRLPSAQK